MIKVLDKPHLNLTTPIGRGFIAFFERPGAGRTPQPGGQPWLARCSWRTLARCEASSLAIVSRPA
jgi:hypothetical protein